MHVAYVKNRLFNKAIRTSQYQKLSGNQPSLHHIRVFGCTAFIYDRTPTSKVHARAQVGIYLGSDDHGIYKCEIRSSRKIVFSRNVTFDEYSFPALGDTETDSSSGESHDDYEPDNDYNSESSSHCSSSTEFVNIPEDDVLRSENDDVPSDDRRDEQVEPRVASTSSSRPTRNRNTPVRFNPSANLGHHYAGNTINIPITTSDSPSVEEALEHSSLEEKELWIRSIQEELENLEKLETWKIVNKKSNILYRDKRKLIPTHIVLKIKRDKNGKPVRFKARIVAGGNLQIKGIDYQDVYAPVVDFSLVRTCIALAFLKGWKTCHVDITAAFLNGEIDSKIIVTSPVNLPKSLRQIDLFLLRKSLYGLKQAPLMWYRKLIDTLRSMGFENISASGAVMIKKDHYGKVVVIVLVYVDDILFFGKNQVSMNTSITRILRIFPGNNMGEVEWYLNVSISYTDSAVCLMQTAYIEALALTHCLENANKVYSPMASSF